MYKAAPEIRELPLIGTFKAVPTAMEKFPCNLNTKLICFSRLFDAECPLYTLLMLLPPPPPHCIDHSCQQSKLPFRCELYHSQPLPPSLPSPLPLPPSSSLRIVLVAIIYHWFNYPVHFISFSYLLTWEY